MPRLRVNVYVVDTGNNRVVKFNNAGVQLLIISASATTPALNQPWGCIIDSAGFIYISNYGGQSINKLHPNLTQVAVFSASPATFYPTQIALDSANSLFVAVPASKSIVKLSSAGVQQVFAVLDNPYGVAVDSHGTVYVVANTYLSVVVYAANGTNVYNLTTSNPSLASPFGIWVDASFNVFVADFNDARVINFTSHSWPSPHPSAPLLALLLRRRYPRPLLAQYCRLPPLLHHHLRLLLRR